MYTVMLSAGEASGDLHGAGLAAALRALDPEIRLVGFGGEKMRQAGVELYYDMADYSVMGFAEVMMNLPRLFRLRDALVEAMRRDKPDVFVTIDYPDFNMRLAKCAKKIGVPVFSFIPPSAWAWRKGRAKSVAKLADHIAAIFPFETEVYEQAGANIDFVGNPLVDTVKPQMTKEEAYRYFAAEPSAPIVLLLPGSRKQEIAHLLPVMLEAARELKAKRPEARFYMPLASTISEEILRPIMEQSSVEVVVTRDCTYDLMALADVAVATSGTVTLEAALMGLPAVAVYKISAVSYFIGRRLVSLPNFSLPNILAGRRVIPELLQDEVRPARIAEEALALFRDAPQGNSVREALATVRSTLGAAGALRRAAELILRTADERRRKG